MHIFDPGFLERRAERRLGEARPPRQRQRANVDHPLDAGLLQRRDELGHRRAFIADGEDAHDWILSADRIAAPSGMSASSPCSSRWQPRHDPFDIHIIGGGLAGSEAAWQLAEAGLRVRLSEMRGGGDTTPAHETDRLAEMVCSNSFRSDDAEHNAVGLLHQEMRALGSLIMRAADKHRVPAGSALAVDREGFAAEVTRAIEQHPNITIVRERVDRLPDHPTIIATGPLTGSKLAEAIAAETGEGALAFFDAIAPIVHRDSIDMDVAWMAARWDKGRQGLHQLPARQGAV